MMVHNLPLPILFLKDIGRGNPAQQMHKLRGKPHANCIDYVCNLGNNRVPITQRSYEEQRFYEDKQILCSQSLISKACRHNKMTVTS